MPIRRFKEHFARALAPLLSTEPGKLMPLIEYPPDPEMGDLAIPCFTFARTMRKSPKIIAAEAAGTFPCDDLICSCEATGPYINAFIDREALARQTIEAVLDDPDNYGGSGDNGKVMVIDYSGPNIAKPFHIGHLRSTIIGHSIKKMYEHKGWKVIGVNHLGDWGTQFGKLIVAYDEWGRRSGLEGTEPIKYLEELYVRFHKEMEQDPSLEDRARAAFKRLEDGEEHERELWSLFREMSLNKFMEIYRLLGIEFDYNTGEAFYQDQIDEVIEKLTNAGLATESEGALVVKFDDPDMPACLLKKSDGASLYATRDLAAAMYRMDNFKPDRMLYVHGQPQALHFRQVFAVLERFDESFSGRTSFVGFGQYRMAHGKMSTREGNVIYLEDVLKQGWRVVDEILTKQEEEKNRRLDDREKVIRQVGLGGLLFGDLSNDRIKDLTFDWSRVLDPRGDTGPYLQYMHARTRNLLKKSGHTPDPASCRFDMLSEPLEARLLLQIARFSEALEEAANTLKPHVLAHYVLGLAKTFSSYYHKYPAIIEQREPLRSARISLVATVGETLKLGLNLLNIPAPEEM